MKQSISHYYLLANHLQGVTSRHLEKWSAKFGGIKELFAASHSDLLQAGLTAKQAEAIRQADWSLVEKDLAWAKQDHCHLLTLQDEAYPVQLRETSVPPLVLYAKGCVDLLYRSQLAMVGARNATPAALETAKQFAAHLSRAGLCVTSGLAQGIDAASHLGAMQATGHTIAVMGTGMHHCYPPQHQKLAQDLLKQGGLILTEFPLDSRANAYHFPRRNRIIAGLSLGVLVVEAKVKSGSLITAKYALEEGREIFAIPGSIHNPLARGCHALIRQGAKLVETAEDVLTELAISAPSAGAEKAHQTSQDLGQLDEMDAKVLMQIDYAPTPLDVIVWRCGLTVAQISSILLSLEMSGYIQSVAGGFARQ